MAKGTVITGEIEAEIESERLIEMGGRSERVSDMMLKQKGIIQRSGEAKKTRNPRQQETKKERRIRKRKKKRKRKRRRNTKRIKLDVDAVWFSHEEWYVQLFSSCPRCFILLAKNLDDQPVFAFELCVYK